MKKINTKSWNHFLLRLMSPIIFRVAAMLLLLLTIHSEIKSQELWPIGTKWYYSYHYDYGAMDYYLYEVTKDTVVKSKNCKIITENHCTKDSVIFMGKEIIYSDSGKIEVLRNDTFSVIFDFNAVVDDTITVIDNSFKGFFHLSKQNHQKFAYTISSEKEYIIQSDTFLLHEVLPTEDSDWLIGEIDDKPAKILFNIGLLEGSEHSMFGYSKNLVSFNHLGCLRCFKSNDNDYNFVGYACDSISIINSIKPKKWNNNTYIYPNPAKNSIRVEHNAMQINGMPFQIFDNTGKVLLNGFIQPGNIIDVSPLASGIYYLKIAGDDNDLRGRFVKQ